MNCSLAAYETTADLHCPSRQDTDPVTSILRFVSGRVSCARPIFFWRSTVRGHSLLATAYHEAGHAVAAFEMDLPVRLIGISSTAGGEVRHRSPFYRSIPPDTMKYTRPLQFRDRIERNVIVAIAGVEAQRRFSARSWRRHHSEYDIDQAAEMLSHLAEGDELTAHFKLLQIRTRNLVAFRWQPVTALANALVEKSKVFPPDKYGWTMTGEEARRGIPAIRHEEKDLMPD